MDFESVDLKDYKGYGISKAWLVDFEGKKKGGYFYLVSEGEEYIGEEYKSLEEAKRFVDSL